MGNQDRSLFSAGQDFGATAKEIRMQFRRILESPEFKATAQQRAMLKFGDPLVKASAFGFLGKMEEGKRAGRICLNSNPIFRLEVEF